MNELCDSDSTEPSCTKYCIENDVYYSILHA